ncbi:MAG: hypothetical protein KAT05_04005, partial [Spirochaetes bacterium]|nr:hypothetical protein [Spirochaetota bacterium]
AEIEILSDMIKTSIILHKVSVIDEKFIFEIYLKYLNRSNLREKETIGNPEEKRVVIVKSLREQNQKLFDYRTIGKLLNCSTGKAHNLIKEE